MFLFIRLEPNAVNRPWVSYEEEESTVHEWESCYEHWQQLIPYLKTPHFGLIKLEVFQEKLFRRYRYISRFMVTTII